MRGKSHREVSCWIGPQLAGRVAVTSSTSRSTRRHRRSLNADPVGEPRQPRACGSTATRANRPQPSQTTPNGSLTARRVRRLPARTMTNRAT